MSVQLVMPSNCLILCHPLLLLPSIFPSITIFSNESALSIRWSKYWSFSFNISSSNEHSGLISFRMNWLDLLAVQGTHKNLLQYPVSKHQFLVLSFLYSPTLKSIHDHWKNHSLDQADLCWQSNISAFLYAFLSRLYFLEKLQISRKIGHNLQRTIIYSCSWSPLLFTFYVSVI